MSATILKMERQPAPLRPPESAGQTAWRSLTSFAFVLTVVGLADVLLVFYPARFGDPSWEFGAIDTALSTMPLLVVGLAALFGAAIARRDRAQIRLLGALALLTGVTVIAAFILYLTAAPIAVRNAPDEFMPGVYKSIVRTTLMSLLFGSALISGAVTAFRARAA